MAHKVVYLQQNEKMAAEFEEHLSFEDVELVQAKTGEEALKFIQMEKVLLLLIDINIPDMRLTEFVERVKRISPRTLINVCIDVLDPMLITMLANRLGVNKIFVAPWDIEEVVMGTKESIEFAIINEELDNREDKVTSEIEELKTTLEALKDRLKKQKRSYAKLSKITECFTEALSENRDYDETLANKHRFAKEVFDTLLRFQTADSFQIEHFENEIVSDFEKIMKNTTNLKVGEIISCLMGGQSRTYAQNIRFAIYMIARFYAEFYEGFEITVSSHYITTKQAEFIVTVATDIGIAKSNLAMSDAKGEKLVDSYYEYIEGIIISMTTNYRRTVDGGTAKYYMSFPVVSE